ncbi:hypothetical protein [Chryseobacterium sp. ISL-6]|uniref:hypothetical protein n=1 Tax=Chryseobacterium sp. ISL-6 TaxID=2819143 RepID=UPI0020358D7F|nr:hypothetical protein [Chryseobacterium sp. ISL-6]
MIKTMKLKSIMLIISGMLTIAACNNNGTKNNDTKNNNDMTEQNNSSLFPKGEKSIERMV